MLGSEQRAQRAWQSEHDDDDKRQSGRWGVAQGCNCRSILDAIGTLIEAKRPDLAMVLIEQEINYWV
jgi:hypothetical protein